MPRFSFRRYDAAHERAVESAFATVPHYRERWSEGMLADPTPVEEIHRRYAELVPLRGGPAVGDPYRGRSAALRLAGGLPQGALLVEVGPLPPTRRGPLVRLRRRVPCLPPPGVRANPFDPRFMSERALRERLYAGRPVALLGPAEDVDAVRARLAAGPVTPIALYSVPLRGGPDADPGARPALVHDPLLGYVGARVPACGRWHLDWPAVYCRPTAAGMAWTLLRQRSPRLVDVLLGTRGPDAVALCPEHGTPVVTWSSVPAVAGPAVAAAAGAR